MFNIKQFAFNIFLIGLFFLNHNSSFSIKSDSRYFNSKLAKSLSTRFEYPRDNSRVHYNDGLPEEETLEGDPARRKNIAEILARGIQTEEDYYKSIKLLNTEVDVLLDRSDVVTNPLRSSLIRDIEKYKIEIDNFEETGGPIRRYGQLCVYEGLRTKRTSNCWGQRYDYREEVKTRLVPEIRYYGSEEYWFPFHNGKGSVCYRPKEGEAGNMLYSFKEGENILEREVGLGYDFVNKCDGPVEIVKLADPTLRLEFAKIFKPCTLEISIADTADHIISYPKLTCVPEKLTYTIGLVSENTSFDFTQVKDISFIFKPVGSHEEEEAHFYLNYIGIDPDDSMSEAVPEPVSLVTMGLGAMKLMRKQKYKADLYKNKFESMPLPILVR